MKKFYLLLMIGFMTIGLSAQNLVLNPGFEAWDDANTPTSWTKAENVEQESVAENVHSQTYSAKHTADGTKDLSQTFAVEAGKTYKLSIWYKNENGDGTDCRIWSNWVADGVSLTDDDAILKNNSAYFTSSATWNEYSVILTAPSNATDFYLEVRSYGSAITYWEDFSFEEITVTKTASPLFFSEYIEGSSSNKALEIYNPNDAEVDLSSYQIAQSSNGGGWQYYHEFPVGAAIAAGDVWVIVNSQISSTLFPPENADEVLSGGSAVSFNGDDARAIVYITDTDTTILDVIGIPVESPYGTWDVAGVTGATKDHTLIRKDGTTMGTDDWAASAGTDADNSQWIVFDQNYFDDLGSYGPDVKAPEVVFSPEDGAMSVSTGVQVVLTFNEPIFGTGGAEITDPTALVELRETDNAGAVVPFTASINAEKTEITIVPDAALSNDQLYFVALLAGVVEDEVGNGIETVISSTFTTIGPIEVTYPAGGEVFYPGKDVHIDWISDNVGNITIWVSFNNGVDFVPIVENIDPAPGTVNYTIPSDSPASLEAVIRITEATNTTFEAGEPMDDSEPFYILPVFTISDIQGTLEADGNSSYEDTICITTGIVTYANGTNEYYISDGTTNDYSAIAVRDNVNKPAVGDSIVIAGTVDEYYNLTQMNDLLHYELIASGKNVPAPVSVTTGAAGEAQEGLIVSIADAVVTKEANNFGEVEVDDGSGVILIDDVYFAGIFNLGGTYNVTGPLSFAYNKWRIYPRTADDVVEVLSSDATLTSAQYTVDNDLGTIADVPALEDLATFESNLVAAYGATFEVYEADGTTVANDLKSDYNVIVTAQDGTTKTYIVTKAALSSDATVSSLVYAIDDNAGTINGVLFKASVSTFEALLLPATGASFFTYQADGVTEATDLATGYKLIVTAEDGTTTKTYTITIETEMPADLIFSEYIEGSGNNKAIEVFNPNDEAIKLDYYQVAQISNGGDDWEYFHAFPVGSVLGSHETWVMITDQTEETMFPSANAYEVLSYPSVVHHNGDDARGLVIVTGLDTTLVDIIGEVGPDPGSGWDVAGVTNATAEHTIIRKGSILEGNTDWASSAGTNADDSEWIVKDQDFFDSLGVHIIVAPEPSDDATLSDLLVDGTSIDGFTPAQLSYFVTLPSGTTTVPTVTATTADANATVNIVDATDLSGDAAARTTTIEVTAEDGVTMKTYSVEFTVDVSARDAMLNRVQIYPVPAINTLHLANASEIRTLTVYDITGAAVQQTKNAGEARISMDITSLDSGVYMIRLENEDATRVVRFVKQ
ncbi:MAG: lamin tail domain-containing protein [Bacteroidales bacterium]|nr:lamin tail domain-containing protein [Bacteroidales bacterium]